MLNVKIVSTSKCFPKHLVTDKDMDKKLGTKEGWVAKKSGVLKRYFIDDETQISMGATAALGALKKAGLKFSDIDALISTSGVPAQPIPSNAALISEAMGETQSGIPCFDINSTCLSFLVGFETISYAIAAGKYNRVLLVSTEVASVGLNFEEKESASLMGDGAAAVIIERDEKRNSGIIMSRVETYSSGAHSAEIRGGGTLKHATRGNGKESDFLFNMSGKRIFRQASQLLLPFFERFFKNSTMKLEDFKLVIPHQASVMALQLVQSKLKLPDEKFFIFVQDHGNTIAASIPMGIHNAIENKMIERGDKVLLLGTSAGFSIGALGFIY